MPAKKPAVRFDESQLEHFTPANRKEWRVWLKKNHTKAPGVWLVFYKKYTGKPTVSYNDAVEEALCFGWIDSKMQVLDDERHRQIFTPRKAKSVWSKLNKQRVAMLIEQGLMAEAGLKAIEVAKQNGQWTILDSVEALIVPPDFAEALKANDTAAANFAAFPPNVRKRVLYRINAAKRPETRAERIAHAIWLAERNDKTLRTTRLSMEEEGE